MKKLSLSKFDLGMIIVFVVIGLLGGGAWWYLSGALTDAQTDVSAAKQDFDSNSVNQNIVVSRANQTILHDNIAMLKSQLNPLIITTTLQNKDNKLASVSKQDPVAWKHDLDNEVRRLTTAAQLHGVKIPNQFYFAFSRYLNQNPEDEQTVVLSKQLLAVEQLSNILINAPVKSILFIRRTYEEEGRGGGGGGAAGVAEPDRLGSSSFTSAAGTYTAYPFELEFEAAPDTLRKVIDDLVQSPYIFVIRTVDVQNTKPASPQLSDLDAMAGPSAPSVIGSSPGEVAATTSVQGPQYLFGNHTLHVKIRVDLIEWTTPPSE